MKAQNEIYRDLMCTLNELQSGSTRTNPGLDIMLRHKLAVLYDILGDDVPEDFWEQIELELTWNG